MHYFDPAYPAKRKNSAGLSPEAREWLRAIALIAILPGTLLIIGLIIWLSLAF